MYRLASLLVEVLNEAAEVYKDDPSTWTHVTSREETIQQIKHKKAFFGPNESPSDFQYEINKGISANKQNQNSPNFYKGSIYPGAEGTAYLIAFKAKQTYPGDDFESQDWKEVDYPLIPNGNRVNRVSFKKSNNIGVLKPEYRGINNFTLYKYNAESKQYVEFDI